MPTINKIYRIMVLLLVCWGAQAWFTWEWTENTIYKYVVYLLFSAISYIYMKSNHIKLEKSPRIILAFIVLYIALVPLSYISGIGGILLFLFYAFNLWVLLSDKLNSCDISHFIGKSLSYILIPGIILNLAFIVIGTIPSFVVSYSGMDMFNYIVLLKPLSSAHSYSRFHSIFLEPGYLGTLISFVLYSTKFEFKERYTKVLLLGLLMTFSIAGFITTFIGYILVQYSNGIKIKKLFLPLVLLLPLYYFGLSYNDGDNVINHAVIERLQFDEEKGLSGNDRFSRYTDEYYENMSTGEFLFGLGSLDKASGQSETQVVGGAGYKIFIISKGFICALLYLFFYILLGNFNSYHRKYTLGFIVIITMTFLQAAYPSSFSWLIPYLLGVNSYQRQHYEENIIS